MGIFPLWHFVKAHLHVPDQSKLLLLWRCSHLAHDNQMQLINFCTLLFPMEAPRVYLVFHKVLLHFGLIFVE